MEERYAGILAALHPGPPAGASTEGIYGSRHEHTSNEDGRSGHDMVRTSSPTLPLDVLAYNDDQPYIQSLFPPPAVAARARTSVPPSAYVDPHIATRRRSSPGPDAAAWLGGHSIAPSCASHYAHSQTMGSGSGSCSVDMLTRTHTGSDEPLLGIGRPSEPAPAHTHPQGQLQLPLSGNKPGLGSAFGSAEGSLYSPSYSYDARSGSRSGSGSYGYTRSGTPSSFDVLRSVSSQGALSSSHSHGQSQGFRFGFGAGSGSSASSGKKRYRTGFGHPQSSFRWKDRGSSTRNKDIPEDAKEKDWRRSAASSVSASGSGSVDERRGRSSPGHGVRALLGRLRRSHTPSPMSSSRGLTATPTRDVDVEKTAAAGEDTSPTQTRGRSTVPSRTYSYVLSNPDPPSLYGARDALPSVTLGEGPSDATLYDLQDSMYPPITPWVGRMSVPSPAPTEASRLPDGLLHPRLQIEGRSATSLRDFEDYSRPIGGVSRPFTRMLHY